MCYLYGKPNYTSVNKLRFDIVRQKYLLKGPNPLSNSQGIDMSVLPPCQQALKMHSFRANYQALTWRQADLAHSEIPDPLLHGWIKSAAGVLSIDWCKDWFPQQLVDIIYENGTHEDEAETEEFGEETVEDSYEEQDSSDYGSSDED